MHRTVNVGALNSKSVEVNGTKPKSLRTGREMPHRQKKSRARMQSLLGLQFVYMGVFSDDFATVDVREELCYHSRPKKHKFRGLKEVFIQSGLSCRRNRGQKIIRTLTWCLGSYYSGMVRMRGLEPPRRGHKILSLTRLPVSPHPHFKFKIKLSCPYRL